MKIVTVVGARPQFIKLSPLSRELRKISDEKLVHTGQHFDKEMSKLFFDELRIPKPDYNLEINGGNHGEQTGRMLSEIEKILIKEKPDGVIVFGDTNSTIAGALAASKLGIKLFHVESGLRSFNKAMPEEINRIVADHVSDYLFAPTDTAMYNLKKEGLEAKTFLTGDIMVDSLKEAKKASDPVQVLKKYGLKEKNYYLCTLHRPYNVDNPKKLQSLIAILGGVSKTVIFPVHPRTQAMLHKYKIGIPQNVKVLKPLGYIDFVSLESKSYKIITDSGGIQKEAYILKKPCITLRSETEWVETVASGWNILVDAADQKLAVEQIESFTHPRTYNRIFGQNVARAMVAIIGRVLRS
jgi:UDP-N-acetylglucosamine 2-epimerase